MKRLMGVASVLAVAFAMQAGSASAAFTVGSGGCTLIVAIEEANAETNGACGTVESVTTINVPAGHYTLSGTQLEIESDMAIVGANPSAPAETIIDAGGVHSRVFEVDNATILRLKNVEVTGGKTENGVSKTSDGENGFEGVEGGGILNRGNLTLEHVLLTGNKTGHGGSGGDGNLSLSGQHNGGGGNQGGSGGGIYNAEHATLEVIASTISGNETGGGGNGGDGGHGSVSGTLLGGAGGIGGYGGDGGGIDSFGNLRIVDSTISDNKVGRGGNGGQGGEGVDATEMHASGRGGDGGEGGNGGVVYSGGGIPTYGAIDGGGGIASFGGTLEIIGSTIVGNETGAGGMGGTGGTPGEAGMGRFDTSGRAGHGGGGGLGGGILINAGSATLTNDTIVENRTGDGGQGGGGANAGSLGGGAGNFGGYGAGVWTTGSHGSPFHLTFLTISKNILGAAGPGGEPGASTFPGVAGGPGQGGGLAIGEAFSNGAAIDLAGSIVAGNTGPQCEVNSENFHDNAPNVSYPDATCKGTSGVNADPMLGALGNNGGLTQTMLPSNTGAALGAVPIADCSPREDQRGVSRPGANKTTTCDAGAVEIAAPPPAEPVVTSISPTKGPAVGGTVVTITGEHLSGATAVDFGLTAGTSVTPVSATELKATSPAGTPSSTVDVTVTTGGGTSSTGVADRFGYEALPPAPVVTSIAPTKGPAAGGTVVTITGEHLSGASAVKFGTFTATGLTPISATELKATSPAGSPSSTVDVTVVTGGGTSATGVADRFGYEAVPKPVVSSITPTKGPAAGGTVVTVTGEHLSGATAVDFGATAGTSVTPISAIELKVTSPAGAPSSMVDVTVTTAGGTSATVAGDRFSYEATPTAGGGGTTPPPSGAGTTPPATGSTPPPPSTGGGSTVGTPSVGGAKVSGTTVSAPITCAGPTDVTCVVKVILSAAGGSKGAPRVLLAKKGKGAKKVTVGAASASIPGGSTKDVSVSLNGAGKSALKKAHKLKTTLTVTVNGAASALFTHAVTFASKG